MGKTRPPYPAEFRREALGILRSGTRTPAELARELGCTEQTLRNWLRQDEADRGERADMLTSDERARLRELERENRVLRQEREILKRAAAFFVLSVTLSWRSAGWLIFLLPGRSDLAVVCSLSCRPLDAPQKRPGVTS